MPRLYKPYIAKTKGELYDMIGSVVLDATTFRDDSGYFPDMNIDTAFEELNGSLDHLRRELGDERYAKMRDMSDRMRALFEADPEDTGEETMAGRQILFEMEQLLRRKRAVPKSEPPAA